MIPQLRRLTELETIYLQSTPKDRPDKNLRFSDQLLAELQSALPDGNILRGGGIPFGLDAMFVETIGARDEE